MVKFGRVSSLFGIIGVVGQHCWVPREWDILDSRRQEGRIKLWEKAREPRKQAIRRFRPK